MTTPHIAVLGAGYAGLATAQLLARRTGATVTLVNNRDRFVERMRNHQLAGGRQVRRLQLRDRMRTAGTVAVVGAGPTSLETATELAEAYPGRTVRLVSRTALGDRLSEPAQDHVRRALDRLGIGVWEKADVTGVDADGLTLAGGERIGADAVAWTAGFTVPTLAREAGLAVNEHGRLVVDGTLRSRSHPEIYGVGDAAAAHTSDGQVLRMGCGPGGLAAACAFHAISARLDGRTPRPLRVEDGALCISLGRRDGLLQPTDLDGNPRGRVRTGLPVAMLKNVVLQITGRYTPRCPRLVVAGARQG